MTEMSAEEEYSDINTSRIDILSDSRFISINLITFLGIFGLNILPAILPQVAVALSVTDAQIGLLISAFTIPSIFMTPISGVLADLIGRKKIIQVSLALFGVAGLSVTLVDEFWTIFALHMLLGVGFSGMTPLGPTLIGDLYEGVTASRAQGFLSSANGFGNVVAPLLAGLVVGFAWYYPFLFFAAAFPVLVFVQLSLPETTIKVGSSRSFRIELYSYWRAIRSELQDRTLGILYVGTTIQYFVKYGMFVFIPLFVARELGASSTTIGILLSIYGVVRVVVSPFMGELIARSSRKYTLMGSIVVIVASVALVATVSSVYWVGGFFAVYTVGDAIMAPLMNDVVAARTAAEHRGGVVSGLNMLKNVGKSLAPPILGLILTVSGFSGLFTVMALTFVGYGLFAAIGLQLAAPQTASEQPH